MSEAATLRFRVARERVPRLLFALSARCGGPLRRDERVIDLYQDEGAGGRPLIWHRSAAAEATVGSLGAANEPGAPAPETVGSTLRLAGYRQAVTARVEAEVYALGEICASVDHIEPIGWCCEIVGPAEAVDAFAAQVGLTSAERDPRSEIALVAERIESPTRPLPLAEHQSSATPAPHSWVSLFATSVATLALVVIVGAGVTLLLLIACAAALALARLAGFAFARPTRPESSGMSKPADVIEKAVG